MMSYHSNLDATLRGWGLRPDEPMYQELSFSLRIDDCKKERGLTNCRVCEHWPCDWVKQLRFLKGD